jgi:hypothetical protein
MRYINREVRIIEVARALDLRLDGKTKIHCWHPDRHKHGDRTASVGIRASHNNVKSFGCDSRPLGPIDLVMDVLHISAADAALWIGARFKVPSVPRRRPLPKADAPYRVGYEHGIGLLVRSGLWGTLSEAARCIAPMLLEMAEKVSSTSQDFTLQMSYVAISRFSGVRSPRSVREALVELTEIGFLRQPCASLQRHPERSASRYTITPLSDALREAANGFAAQTQTEIAAEKELRKRARERRIRVCEVLREKDPAHASTKYNSLYPTDSKNQEIAIPRLASHQDDAVKALAEEIFVEHPRRNGCISGDFLLVVVPGVESRPRV